MRQTIKPGDIVESRPNPIRQAGAEGLKEWAIACHRRGMTVEEIAEKSFQTNRRDIDGKPEKTARYLAYVDSLEKMIGND